ncbi:hypothetical protein [Hydrogenophilus thermoluteolus]|uniref:Uncharacterized protein n=1 Tax=Hydrogenophilus thermoluteolus TaxID=297 RepID=A0A2Z6DY60_HYDTE|nr:hypothetical protein [Hydrogenophilus thermoluteolus]BBD77413.1 hypothetical protein HPTL_1149 [Hydrogenophilus thermoluteolus]
MTLATKTELAKLTGVTRQYICKLAKMGVLDGCERDGKFDRDCAVAAIERYRSGARWRANGSHLAIDLAKIRNSEDLAAALEEIPDPFLKVRLMRDFWKARLTEIRVKERSGELVREAEIVAAGQKKVKAMRDKLLAMPSKLAPVVVTMSEREALEVLTAAIEEALEEVATLGTR